MAINIIAPPAVQATRLQLCLACKFYNDNTKSCGTLILGDRVENDEETTTHYRKKIKLCGCVVRAKVKISLFKCPADRWGRHTSKKGVVALDSGQIQRLGDFLKTLDGKNRISNDERVMIYKWANKVSDIYVQEGTCSDCIITILDALKRVVKECK